MMSERSQVDDERGCFCCNWIRLLDAAVESFVCCGVQVAVSVSVAVAAAVSVSVSIARKWSIVNMGAAATPLEHAILVQF